MAFTLRPNSKPQEMFLASDADIVVFGGSAGGGKGLRETQLVLTPFGLKPLNTLSVGSALCATDGTVQHIIGYYPRGEQQFYKLTFSDGSVVECDEDHLWVGWFSDTQCSLQAAKRPTLEIYEEYRNGNESFVLPLISHPVAFEQEESPDPLEYQEDAYAMGVALGASNGYSDTHIPKAMLHTGVTYRLELLRGILDTAGHIPAFGDIGFQTTSENLANDLRYLARSLGAYVEIDKEYHSYTKPDGKWVPSELQYILTISFPDNSIAFNDESKQFQAGRRSGRIAGLSLDYIEKIDIASSVCIAVSHPNSLFILENFVVTHNTYAIMLDTLRYIDDPNYRAVIFRRTSPQITSPGGLWDTASKIYTLPGIDGIAKQKDLKYVFPSGAEIKFSHMEHESDKINWQGSQISAVYWDEATHFEPSQMVYLFSRMRSEAKNAGYTRMTCNPDPDHKLRVWLDWWLDKQGLPIPERAGVKRYFVMLGDDWLWANSPEQLMKDPDVVAAYADKETGLVSRDDVMSFTFIPATLADNVDMLKSNPRYKAGLLAMPKAEREKLLGGNWNARPHSGDYFKRSWVIPVDRAALPNNLKRVRYWDRAGTLPSPNYENPDWTVGLLMGKCDQGYYWILDMIRFRETAANVKNTIISTAVTDNTLFPGMRTVLEQDPGQAGKSDVETLTKDLGRYDVRRRTVTKNKLLRFTPFAAACENGLVRILRAPWNDDLYNELECFDGKNSRKNKDDIVDTCSGAYLEFEDLANLPDIEIPSGMFELNAFAI